MEDKCIPKLPTAHILHFRLYKKMKKELVVKLSSIYIFRAQQYLKRSKNIFPSWESNWPWI